MSGDQRGFHIDAQVEQRIGAAIAAVLGDERNATLEADFMNAVYTLAAQRWTHGLARYQERLANVAAPFVAGRLLAWSG